MPQAKSPRITPMPLDEMPEDQRRLARLGADTVVQVLAHNPGLMTVFQQFGGFLLAQGSLDPRIRELAILRVALRCDAPYEWANHVPAAIGAGATVAEIDALSAPDASWDTTDKAVLHAVDELCTDTFISDETWAQLAATRDNPQIIELIFLIGFYQLMAGFLNSAGVPVKPGQPALGEHGGVNTDGPGPVVVPRVSSGRTAVAGSWNLTMTHPAGSKLMVFTLETADNGVSGTVFDPQLDITVPITSGTVEGQHVTITCELTEPVKFDVNAEGTVDGDVFTGTVTISAGGTFPLTGTRVV